MSDTIQGLRKDKLVALIKEWKDSGKFNSVAAICRKYPIDPSYISQIKSGHRGFGEEAARTLETALDLPKFYFEPNDPTSAIKASSEVFSNARLAVDKPVRFVPVLNFVQAGEFCQYYDNAIADEFEPVIGEGYGERVYWVELDGDSMYPDFNSGELVLIDPDIQPIPADYVLAIREDVKETTFKKWRPRGFDENTGKEYCQLIPSNTDYPIIDSRFISFTICGVAVEQRKRLRK